MFSKPAKRPSVVFLLHASIAAFGTYFCMYAFRKPFTVATYEGLQFMGLDYKILLIIAQVFGYTLSKFLGIKIISELKPNQRLWYLIFLIGIAEVALVFFALVPPPYNIGFMFLNGIPLGMIWGIVFSYLEGRRMTDILGIILCSSFIVSSGVVKSVALYLMNRTGVTEFWMPAVTGAFFLLPLLVFGFLLKKVPEPTKLDKQTQVERVPMTKSDRRKVIAKFIFPLTIVVLFYVLLTAFRDFRDNFARELWDSIGFKGNSSVYSTSEIIVAIIVLVLVGSIFYIKDNLKALMTYHSLLVLGTTTLGIATVMFQLGWLDPFIWMVLTGFGLYVCYVPFNCLFFDRFIATFRIKGNSGFLIYIADAFGYVGSVLVLLYKNFGQATLSWLDYFIYGAYSVATLGLVITVISAMHLRTKYKMEQINTPLGYGQ